MTLPRTALNDLFGIEHPVIQAPMSGAATPEMAIAVSACGGLGSLGSAVLSPDELREQAEAVRAATERPFNLNFFCHPTPDPADLDPATGDRLRPLYEELGLGEPPRPFSPPFEFGADHVDALAEIRPAVVSFHFGLPDDGDLSAIKDLGCVVLSSATTVAEAVFLSEHGVDVVIAQGSEAGGHRGSFLVDGDDGPVGTLALVPQVCDAVDLPVIAAGGIADGRGLAAALALGASGAQIGTAFLTCPEAAVPPAYRESVMAAAAESTTITRVFSGRPARALRNRLTDSHHGEPLPYPAQLSLTGPLAAAATGDGSTEFLPMWAGQAAPLSRALPAGELLQTIVEEADHVLTELGGDPGAGEGGGRHPAR